MLALTMSIFLRSHQSILLPALAKTRAVFCFHGGMVKRLCMSLWLFSLLIGCGPSSQPAAQSTTMPTVATVAIAPSATLSSPTVTALPTRTFTPAATPFPRATVAKETLLRNGPSVEFSVAAKLATGASVELHSRNQDNTWVQVKSSQGDDGWIPIDALRAAKEPISGLPEATFIPDPPLPLLNWTGDPVQTVCLSIKRTFADEFAKDHADSKPMAIDDEITEYLQGLGMTVVAPGARCDATLAVEQTILPTGDTYRAQITNAYDYCYSGVKVDSLATLTAPNAKLEYATYQSRTNEPQITGCPSISRDLGESYFSVGLALREFWGDNALGVMLESNQMDVTKYALNELAQLGPKGRRFVPAIIDFLRQPGPETARIPAASALQEITLMNYGTNADDWELWWATQLFPSTQEQPVVPVPTSRATSNPQVSGTPSSKPSPSPMRPVLPTVPPAPALPSCSDTPAGMAGLLWINQFDGEATITIVDHEYHVPGNTRMLIPIPPGKKFVIDAFIPGVGRMRPAPGPFTWDAGYCEVWNPGRG